MQFGFLGLSYKNADLDIRDKTAFTDSKKIDFLQKLDKIGIDQCMILSTCNRSEIYYFYDEKTHPGLVKKEYIDTFNDKKLEKYLIEYNGYNALEYLFRVAAGMESQVIGEDQILGQVKDALVFSRTMGYSKKELNKVVRDAITCAKRIKTELKISEIPLSVSYVGIRQLEESCGICGKRVFIIGSGKTSALSLKYVYEYGAEKVILCSRTFENARQLQKEYSSLEIVEYEKRYEILEKSDIVISATSSPHVVLKKENVNIESNKKIYMLDLATPRDIDVKFAEDENYYLINLDSLQQIVLDNHKERENLIIKGLEYVKEDLKETINWLLSSRMDETIESLQQRCNDIVEDSYNYLNKKIDLSEREKRLLRKTINASLQRLIKEPINELKQLETIEEQNKYKEIVHKLFQF